ncbi:hypothetical protein [Microbulbifer epialgicus]|uniref:Curli production assembly/transport component CsgG n=1 Tax=Microbulbifer epialgicus TaxID=393907 RepID=A0ABV4P3D7_9GAMM
MNIFLSKSVLNEHIRCQFPVVYGSVILKLIAILLAMLLPLKSVEAKIPVPYKDFYKLNDDILSKLLSFDSGQVFLKQVGGSINGSKTQDISIAIGDMVDKVKEVFLSKNQGLLSLLSENSIRDEDAFTLVKILSKYLDVNTLAVGKKFRLVFDGQSQLQSFSVKLAFAESLEIKRSDQGFIAIKHKNSTSLQNRYVEGEITGSLYNTGLRLGLSNTVLIKLNEILSYEVDFQRDIHTGDRFFVFYSILRDDLDGSEIFHSIRLTELSLANSTVTLYTRV